MAARSTSAALLAISVRRALEGSDAQVSEVLPGLCHVHLPADLPFVRVACEDGWTSLSAVVHPAQDAWALIGAQARGANIKYALVADSRAEATVYQLRAEIPVDPRSQDDGDRAWFTGVLGCLRRLLSDSDELPAAEVTSHPTESVAEALADLGYSLDPSSEGEIGVSVHSNGQPRRVRLHRDGGWWCAELPLGTGDVLAPVQPMRQAVGLFLLRAAAEVRFARPYCGSAAAPVLGFDVHLPLQPTGTQLEHAIAALVTAVQRYETEIETLAVEAILSHAFVVIAGAPDRGVNPPTCDS
jgi:hypothetical protein